MATVIDDLVVKLGLDSNPNQFTQADKLVETLRAHLVQISVDVRMAADAFRGAKLVPDKKPAEETDSASKRLLSTVKKLAAAYLGLRAVQGLKGMIHETIEAGSKINDLSIQTGIGAEALQGYAHAAQLNGSSLEKVVAGAEKLNIGIANAAKTGKGPAKEALDELGLSATKLKKTIEKDGLEAGFDTVAEKLAALPDGAKKNRLAFELLGKSGRELIPTINGLADAQRDAEELGLIISSEDIKNLDDLGDETDRLKGALTGLKNQAVAALVPLLKDLATGALEWMKQNRELIASGLKAFVSALSVAFKVLAAVIKGIVAVFAFMADNWDVVQSVLIAIGIVVAALSAEFVIMGIKAAAAWVAAFAPIAAAVVIITGIIIAIKLLVKHWDKVKDAVRGVWRSIVSSLSDAWNSVKEFGNDIMNFFTTTVPNAIIDAFDRLWEAVKQGARDAGNFLRNLPVVKQALDFAGFVSDDVLGSSAPSIDAAMAAVRGQEDRTRAPDAAGGGVSVQGGPVSIEVNSATGDPIAIGAEVQKRMQEHMDNLFQQTADAL